MSNPTPTTITTAYNNLVALIAAALPDHLRLDRPEDLGACPQPQLKNGWGIHLEGGQRDDRNICPNYFWTRTIEITLTKEIVGKGSDVEKREQCKLWLLEDLHVLLAALVTDLNLSDSVTEARPVSDNGPQEEEANGLPIVTLDLTLQLRYQQQVSGGV